MSLRFTCLWNHPTPRAWFWWQWGSSIHTSPRVLLGPSACAFVSFCYCTLLDEPVDPGLPLCCFDTLLAQKPPLVAHVAHNAPHLPLADDPPPSFEESAWKLKAHLCLLSPAALTLVAAGRFINFLIFVPPFTSPRRRLPAVSVTRDSLFSAKWPILWCISSFRTSA